MAATKVRDVMTADPVCLYDSATLTEAAQRMREFNIGDVLVVDDEDQLAGIVTDRDIVIRAVATGLDPASTPLGDVTSEDYVTVNSEDPISEAVRLMRENALRRLPVTDEGHVVGIIALSDLSIERDPESALADISSAPPSQ